ncbi:hypothetical protein [Dolichospermum sp. UHCC 0259]|uniref:hypothetical protein n=1 Tax=Dolichospermum sp. UHCC 0259 TaxID=2590010 RepID=UPI0014471EC7|nr:hypothetical protein [Dolichospermum sp. UHCC 0259]MTJ48171.1 hypothetical protein [Dolichospermum sp. UHCC 0259]
MFNLKAQSEALANRKAASKHQKQFNQGIDLYFNNCNCPLEDSAITDGWLCAQKMREVKNQALAASRQKFNVM